MRVKHLLFGIKGGINTVIKPLTFAACVVLAVMTLLVVYNVLGRFLFHKPVLGTIELVELMMVIIGFFGMVQAAVTRKHVIVDMLITHLSKKTQVILAAITAFLSAGIVGVITYQAIINTVYYWEHLGEVTTVLYIPLAPFKLLMALACLLLCLAFLAEVARSQTTGGQEEGIIE